MFPQHFTQQQIKDEAARLRRVADSVKRLDMFKADVETGIFASQLVTVTLAELFRHEFPETKWINGGLVPISTTVNEGALFHSYVEMIHGGRAEIVAPNATDLPAVDVQGRNNVRNVQTVAECVKYSTQDLRTARLQGMFDIANEKAVAAREAMDRRLNILLRTGQEDAGLRGVTNAPGITVVPAITGDWENPATTGAEIVADFTAAANTAMNATDGVEMPNTAIFDVASWNVISTRVHLPAASDRTILSFLREAFPMITRWDWEHGMREADQAGTGPAALIYRNEPTRLRAVFPMMMRALPPQPEGLSFKLIFESRFGGVIVPRPRSVVRLDGIGAP